MGHSDPYETPDLVISGTLAADLVEALDFARFQAGSVARAELDAMRSALVRDIRESPPPVRWITGLDPETVRELDVSTHGEPGRVVSHQTWHEVRERDE